MAAVITLLQMTTQNSSATDLDCRHHPGAARSTSKRHFADDSLRRSSGRHPPLRTAGDPFCGALGVEADHTPWSRARLRRKGQTERKWLFALLWSSPDVIGLFSNNVVSFSPNVVLRGPLFSLNSVSKLRMLSVSADYVLGSLQVAKQGSCRTHGLEWFGCTCGRWAWFPESIWLYE